MPKVAKLVAVLLLAVAGWVVYQYVETGRWSILPVKLTPEEKNLRRLESELADVRAKIAAEERTSGLAGVAPSQRLIELYDRREALGREIEAAKAAAAGVR